MVVCDQCRGEFPAELVREVPAFGAALRVCGVCALALMRREQGRPGAVFWPGSPAADAYQRCRMILEMRRATAGGA